MNQGTFDSLPVEPSEQMCKDAAVLAGGTEQDGEDFYVQYASQGWKWGNGVPICNLQVALKRWIRKQAERPKRESTADRLKRIEQEGRV